MDVLPAVAARVAALTAAYAGHLAAPMSPAARLLLGAAGLAAAFLHLLPAPARLAVALAAMAVVWGTGRAGARQGKVA